jgi:DNA polymerase I-like protein with 3'-5' exonuclease and polymerase domains
VDEKKRGQMIPYKPTEVHYIKNEEDVGRAVGHLLRFDRLGFDTETYHSRDKRIKAFDPTNGARMRLSQWATPEGKAFIFDHFSVSKTYLYMMFPNVFTVVGQNLKFDLKFLMYELGLDQFGDIFDCMIAGQLLSKGSVAGDDFLSVSLDALAERELGVNLPKDEQKSDWWMPNLSDRQIEYAATDPLICLAIMDSQVPKLVDSGQVRIAETEFRAIAPVGDIELNGIELDAVAWMNQYHKTEKKIEKVKEELWASLGVQKTLFAGAPQFNLNSGPEMIKIFEDNGLPVPINPKTNRKALDGKLLTPYEEDYPIISKYKEYKGLSKDLTSYGPSWVDMINPQDKRIHANFRLMGAPTGRMSCSGPNIQQIPKEDEYRNCIKAADGWLIVGYDYSQMELRILAEYCRDENFLKAFDLGYDLHRYTASLIFKIAMDAVTGKQRGIAKNLNFGIVYGIGVLKFSVDAKIPLAEAKAIMDFYLHQAYPGMSKWLDEQAWQVLRSMTAETMTGRKCEFKLYGEMTDDERKQRMAKIQRNAKNMPIQGTSVDITKRALALVFDAIRPYRKGIRMIHVIHDEILLEALPAYVNKAKEILETCMLRAEREYLKRVPSVVDGSVTLVWTKEATDDQLVDAQRLLEGVQQI